LQQEKEKLLISTLKIKLFVPLVTTKDIYSTSEKEVRDKKFDFKDWPIQQIYQLINYPRQRNNILED